MNYKYEDKMFPVSRFFVKVIIIILSVLLITWLYTKCTNNSQKEKEKTISGQTFSDNLNKLTEVALKYYDEEKLNKITDTTDKITLKELKKKGYIAYLKNKDGKRCSFSDSYVSITNTNDGQYTMKIYLSCDSKKDSISINLKHDDTCNTYLCEIKDKANKDTDESNDSIDNSNTIIKDTHTTVQSKKSPIYTGSIEIVDTTNSRYRYQYAKSSNLQYSKWSNWKNLGTVSCSTNSYFCNNSSICLSEEKIEKQNTNDLNTKYIANKISIQKTGTKTTKVCSNTNYISFNNTLYKVNSDYSNINNWIYVGRNLYKTPPKDTINTKYVYSAIDYSNCKTTCNGAEQYYYDKYIYSNINIDNVVKCDQELKTIDSYSYVSNIIVNYRNENSVNKCYKFVRTRNLIGNSELIWSSYNNKVLLNSGYQYTGKKELIN